MRVRRLALAIALLLCVLPACAQLPRDAVHFGQDIVVPAGQSVRDVLCMLCSVHIDGQAERDVLVVAGNIYISGQASRDVADFGGNITLTGTGSIGRDMVIFGGHLHQDAGTRIGRHHVVLPPIVFLPVLLSVALLFLLLIGLLAFLLRRNARATYPPLPRI